MRRGQSLALTVGLALTVLVAAAGCSAAVQVAGRIVLQIGTRVVILEGAQYLLKLLGGETTADPTITVNYTNAEHTSVAEVYQVEGAKGVSLDRDKLKGKLTFDGGDGTGPMAITVPAGATAEVAFTVDAKGPAPSQPTPSAVTQRTQDPDTVDTKPKVGDCLINDGTEQDPQMAVRDCNGLEGTFYKVLRRFDGRIEGDAAAFAKKTCTSSGYDKWYFYDDEPDSLDYVLCMHEYSPPGG